MNEFLAKFREQYPDYNDMSDADLAEALHAKFYADMAFPEFAEKIGFDPQAQAVEAAQLRLAAGGGSAEGDFLQQAAGPLAHPVAGGIAKLAALGPDPAAMSQAGDSAEAASRQRTADLNLLAPEASARSRDAGLTAAAGPLLAGLGPAMNAIRLARGSAVSLTPAFGGGIASLPTRSALEALRAAAKSPFARRLLPWAGGALIGDMIRD